MERETNHHGTRTSWHYDTQDGFYTRRIGESVGVVWLVPLVQTWAARVYIGPVERTEHSFTSMTEAQMWCEEYIAQWQLKEREAGA
jgi:hypothetical protein